MSVKPYMLFESYPDFSGSPLKLYNTLKSMNYGSKYDMVWAVDKDAKPSKLYKTVPFFRAFANDQNSVLRNTAIIIDSNRYIYKRPNNYRLHVRHGCSFKACLGYYGRVGEVDSILTTSNSMMNVDKQVWPANISNKFIITGLPSNDFLFDTVDLYKSGFIHELTGANDRYNKIIGWLPTFRQHRHAAAFVPKGHIFPYGLPTIGSIDDFKELNEVLRKTNILVLVQMHHAQSNNFARLPSVSNIKFITEPIKNKYGLTTHMLMSAFDAMITDYSAAYHEYIILDRPICLTVDDLIEYNDAVGFCYDYTEWIKGEYALRKEHIYRFIINLANGNDVARELREDSLRKIHKYVDGNSAVRVVNYLKGAGVL